jgi:hypothetical protein
MEGKASTMLSVVGSFAGKAHKHIYTLQKAQYTYTLPVLDTRALNEFHIINT